LKNQKNNNNDRSSKLMSYYYLPIISIDENGISLKEARGTSAKGFDYQEFVLADTQRCLLENQSSYLNLHHVGEFMILKRVNYSDWLKTPNAYVLISNPSGVLYSWHSLDWQGFGHKVYGKRSLYEIIPVNIPSKRVSINIETNSNNNRVVLMFENPGWIVVDPSIHDALYAVAD
jgi:hypothetical protein